MSFKTKLGFLWNKIKAFSTNEKSVVDNNKNEDEQELKIVKSLSAFREIKASDIMVTRKDIFAFPIEVTKEDLLRAMEEHHYTRIPIYKDNLDNIVGFVHIKDILRNINHNFQVENLVRNIIFVPTQMKAVDLLLKMQSSHIHVAIVLDEYGGTEGLITIVNIIEEIVGNIDDEHDQSTNPALIKIANGKFEVEGSMPITSLSTALNLKFDDTDDYETLSGLINTLAGRIPQKGEIIRDENVNYEIKDADSRCIFKVIITINDAA